MTSANTTNPTIVPTIYNYEESGPSIGSTIEHQGKRYRVLELGKVRSIHFDPESGQEYEGWCETPALNHFRAEMTVELVGE